MNIKIFGIIFFIFLLDNLNSFSQNYKQGLGFRFGAAQGITYKKMYKPQTAFEIIGSFNNKGFGLTGLLEKHGKITQIPNLYWYIGGGGHVYFNDNYNDKYNANSSIGVDGILGLEAKLTAIPLLISLDWKPSINFNNNYNHWRSGPGLSLRYTW